MEPTLGVGGRVLVNRLAYDFGDPSVGDVVVFHPPTDTSACGIRIDGEIPFAVGAPCPQAVDTKSTEDFVKRIVAGPGDTLSIKDGHPVVNGVEKENEPYTNPCDSAGACNLPKTITIPTDHYFMMGDNREHSNDSRFWGPVPRDWIIGKVFVSCWPPNRWGFL